MTPEPIAKANDAGERLSSAEERQKKLLASITANTGLPSIGAAIGRIVTAASSEKEDVAALASLIMNDVALTQKVLRSANAVRLRGGGPPCTMVSRAVMLMGFDAVKNTALSALLLDMMSNRVQAAVIHKELSQSFLASVLAREVPHRQWDHHMEELSASALLKGLGRMLVAAHDLDLYKDVKALVQDERIPETVAAHRLFGMSYDTLTEHVMEQWGLPPSLIAAIGRFTPPAAGITVSQQEWNRGVVSFSVEVAEALAKGAGAERERELAGIMATYGDTLSMSRNTLDKMMGEVRRQVFDAMCGMNLAPVAEEQMSPAAVVAAEVETSATAGILTEMLEQNRAMGDTGATETPEDGRSTLLGCVQEVTRYLVSENAKVLDALTLIGEGIFRGLKMDSVLIGIFDRKAGCYRVRVALGSSRDTMLADFRIPAQESAPDLFNTILSKGTDVYLQDASKIQDKLPGWYKNLNLGATRLLLLPVTLRGKTVGFIYSDARGSQEAFSADTLVLTKTLRGQVALVLKTLG